MGPATRRIVDAGEKLGYFMEPMPKFIDFEKCDGCGLCINGCRNGAKWDSTDFINEIKDSSTLITSFNVTRVLHSGGQVEGVEGLDEKGEKQIFRARKVVLAAGALNTPKILKNSGITDGVGEGLFTDLFITVGGFLKGAKLNKEILMGVKAEFGPYFLSPHTSGQLVPILKKGL